MDLRVFLDWASLTTRLSAKLLAGLTDLIELLGCLRDVAADSPTPRVRVWATELSILRPDSIRVGPGLVLRDLDRDCRDLLLGCCGGPADAERRPMREGDALCDSDALDRRAPIALSTDRVAVF